MVLRETRISLTKPRIVKPEMQESEGFFRRLLVENTGVLG